MTVLQSAAFQDAAARGALSTRLLADIGLVDPTDLVRAQDRRRTLGEARRLGVAYAPQPPA